jgi:hypothetical protein
MVSHTDIDDAYEVASLDDDDEHKPAPGFTMGRTAFVQGDSRRHSGCHVSAAVLPQMSDGWQGNHGADYKDPERKSDFSASLCAIQAKSVIADAAIDKRQPRDIDMRPKKMSRARSDSDRILNSAALPSGWTADETLSDDPDDLDF